MMRDHQKKSVITEYIKSEEQPADCLTKPLPKEVFIKQRSKLGLTIINLMLLMAHVTHGLQFEYPIIASRPNRYSEEPNLYMVIKQQVVVLNYQFYNPCTIVGEKESIDEENTDYPWGRFARNTCENRAGRLYALWQSINDRLGTATVESLDPTFYIPSKKNMEEHRLGRRVRHRRGIWMVIGVVIMAVATIIVVHSAVEKAKKVLGLGEEKYENIEETITEVKEEVINKLRGEMWDLHKEFSKDFKKFAYFNEANNHLIETMNNVSRIVDEWKQNRVTRQFFDTLGIEWWPNDRPAPLIKPISMNMKEIANTYNYHGIWNITFTFMTSIVNTDADLRRVEAFTLYDHNSSVIEGYDWCQVKYIGPPAVSPNGLYCKVEFAKKVAEQVYVGTRCMQGRTYEEARNVNNYELWEKECFKNSYKKYNPEAQIKTINDKNYVYCPNYTIAYAHLGGPETTIACPEHVFSLPISTAFTLKEVNYRFEGLEEHINSSNHIQEENIQQMIASYIIPDREFMKSIKPVNVTHPNWLYYAKLVLYIGGITIALLVTYVLVKTVYISVSSINRKVTKDKKRKQQMKEIIMQHEMSKGGRRKKVRPSAPEFHLV